MVQRAIFVEDIEKYFPPAYSGWRALLLPFARATQPALAGVSLAVEAGEVVALIGENGGGKSTLLRILATLIVPTRGRASVMGFDVERDAARVRQQIGYYTGGDEGFYTRLSARENLQLFATMNNVIGSDARREIARVADLMGLGEAMNRQVRTFSTGMVHRLGLARALVHAPAVLLLDEPTRSLDPMTAGEFRRFLKQDIVDRRGTTLLFASHTLSEVEELADRVALLEAGRLLAWDTPHGLRALTGAASLAQAVEKLARRAAPAEALP